MQEREKDIESSAHMFIKKAKAEDSKKPDKPPLTELLIPELRKAICDYEKSRERKEILLSLFWTMIGAFLGLVLSILFKLV